MSDTNEPISQRLLYAARKLEGSPITIGGESEQMAAFCRLAQQVDERESLWRKLDTKYEFYKEHPILPHEEKELQELRKQLGLE